MVRTISSERSTRELEGGTRGEMGPPTSGFSDAPRGAADVRQRPRGTQEWPPLTASVRH